MENLKDGYAFVVKTNEYAGNFEREMTAHITGVIGECGVGEDFTLDNEFKPLFESDVKQCGDEKWMLQTM